MLSPFRKAELALLDGALDRAARAVEVILAQGVGAAMNEFNKKANGREPNSSAGHET